MFEEMEILNSRLLISMFCTILLSFVRVGSSSIIFYSKGMIPP